MAEQKEVLQDPLEQYCAKNTRCYEEMLSLNDRITLHVVHFLPEKEQRKLAVVFVPGWISLMSGWKESLLEMTKDFRVYYVETREKISSKIRGRVKYDIEAIGDDIIHFVEQAQLADKSYVLFGSSLGGTVLLDVYSRLPKKPKALVLVGPNAEFKVPVLWKIIVTLFYPRLYLLIKPAVKWHLRTFRMNIKEDRKQYDKYCRALNTADPWKLKKAARAFWKYQVWDKLPLIDAPVLIIGGSKDKLHEPENLRKITETLPNARYVDMETNARTHTGDMVREMRTFLDSLP